jgi:hypothetical protein
MCYVAVATINEVLGRPTPGGGLIDSNMAQSPSRSADHDKRKSGRDELSLFALIEAQADCDDRVTAVPEHRVPELTLVVAVRRTKIEEDQVIVGRA